MLERWARYYRHNHRLALVHVLSIELNAGEHGISVRFSSSEFSVAAQFLALPGCCKEFTILPDRGSWTHCTIALGGVLVIGNIVTRRFRLIAGDSPIVAPCVRGMNRWCLV